MAREPFGKDNGWRSIMGWIVFGVGAVIYQLPEGLALPVELTSTIGKALISAGLVMAGLGHRVAQGRQIRRVGEEIAAAKMVRLTPPPAKRGGK